MLYELFRTEIPLHCPAVGPAGTQRNALKVSWVWRFEEHLQQPAIPEQTAALPDHLGKHGLEGKRSSPQSKVRHTENAAAASVVLDVVTAGTQQPQQASSTEVAVAPSAEVVRPIHPYVAVVLALNTGERVVSVPEGLPAPPTCPFTARCIAATSPATAFRTGWRTDTVTLNCSLFGPDVSVLRVELLCVSPAGASTASIRTKLFCYVSCAFV